MGKKNLNIFKYYRLSLKLLIKQFEKLVCYKIANVLGMKKLADIEKEDREEHELEDPEKVADFFTTVQTFENANEIKEIGNKKEKSPLLITILSIDTILRDLRNESIEKETRLDREIKWKFAAIVMDRLNIDTYILHLYFILYFSYFLDFF